MSSIGGVAMFTGGFTGAFAPNKGEKPLPLPAKSLVKMDANGRVVWSDAMKPSDGRADHSASVNAVAFDGDDILVLGQASTPITLGGRLVPVTADASSSLARLDGSGGARWVQVFEPAEPVQLFHGRDGGAVVIGGSSPTRVSLVRFDRDGRVCARRSLAADMLALRFASSAVGDSVLVAGVFKTVDEVRSMFPTASIHPPPSSGAIIVGRVPM